MFHDLSLSTTALFSSMSKINYKPGILELIDSQGWLGTLYQEILDHCTHDFKETETRRLNKRKKRAKTQVWTADTSGMDQLPAWNFLQLFSHFHTASFPSHSIPTLQQSTRPYSHTLLICCHHCPLTHSSHLLSSSPSHTHFICCSHHPLTHWSPRLSSSSSYTLVSSGVIIVLSSVCWCTVLDDRAKTGQEWVQHNIVIQTSNSVLDWFFSYSIWVLSLCLCERPLYQYLISEFTLYQNFEVYKSLQE